jgi:2,3-dihydroxybiphenyl 1,2-dioxygenase
MKGISTLSYLVIEASDLSAWQAFAERLGFQVIQRGEAELQLRMDDQSYRIIVSQGPLDDLKTIGWVFPNIEALSTYIAELGRQGIAAEVASTELKAQRQADALYTTTDLNGIQHEFTAGLPKAHDHFSSTQLQSKFLTEEGLGHALISTQDKLASIDFYQRLGLSITDTIAEEIAPGIVIDATFMHVNQRHHSFAFAPMPPDAKRLHHLMVEVESIDDVGLAYDRCNNALDPIVMSLGKHPNDEMFSFYVQSPSGIAVEVGYGGKLIDYQNWQTESFSKLSSWGHKQHRA